MFVPIRGSGARRKSDVAVEAGQVRVALIGAVAITVVLVAMLLSRKLCCD
jgi:hypothetical protein